jgi:hypothetical protein
VRDGPGIGHCGHAREILTAQDLHEHLLARA